MKIKWDSLWLSDEFAADGYQSGLSLNGRQIVQEAQFLRAAQSQFFARGNRSVSLSFSVTRVFSSVSAAEQFFLGHYATIVDGPATLTCRCKNTDGTTTDVLIQNAVLESLSEPRYIGVSVNISYTFRAPAITAVYSPPVDSDVRTLTASIPNGVSSFTVSGLALPSIPARVFGLSVRKPLNGLQLAASLEDGTVTTDGFKVWLTGTTDNANYKLDFAVSL